MKPTFVTHSDCVEKDLSKAPARIETKLLTWARAVEAQGLEQVRRIPGYHDEPLKGARFGQRSIRLNRSYRAIYEVNEQGHVRVVEIKEVTKHDY